MAKRPHWDNHHVMNYRREWTLRPQAEKIRENPWLIAPIDREVHDELHQECPPVPLLGYHALLRVASDFRPHVGDHLKTMDELIRSIDRAIQHPKVKPIEAELGQLTMRAVELQKPFIKKGLVWGTN